MTKNAYIFGLVLAAIGWSLLFVFVIQLKIGFPFLVDDWSYMKAAKKLYWYGGFDEGRPILIAAINGLPLWFGLADAAVVKWSVLVNFGCWLMTGLLVFRLLAVRIGMVKAFFCALLAFSCIGSLAMVFHLMAESVLIFMIVVAVFFISQFHLRKNPDYLAFGIAVLFFAVLIKPIAAGLAVITVIFYLPKWKQVLRNGFSVLTVVALVLIAVQMRGMKNQYGDYTISYIGTVTYYNYLGAKADCLKKDTVFVPGENARAKFFHKHTSHEQKKLVADDFKKQLEDNRGNLAKAYLYCLLDNSSKGSYILSQAENDAKTTYFDAFKFLFKAVAKIQNIIFTVGGLTLSIYFLLRRKKYGFQSLVALMVVYLFLISGMSCGQGDRFHIVFFPLVITLAAGFFEKKKLIRAD